MRLPSFTVTTKRRDNGAGELVAGAFNADSITAVHDQGRPAVAFVCSGSMVVLPAADIERIELHVPDHGGICPKCDGYLSNSPIGETPVAGDAKRIG